jgi:hypothetical protein
MWVMAGVFAFIGYSRGLSKELISLAGIVLALFFLFQYDELMRQTLLVGLPREQIFFIQTILFLGIVFFAYQQRAFFHRGPQPGDKKGGEGRDSVQSSVLGGVVGFVNGYLIWGTIWYLMHISDYPLAPYIVQPPAGSPSAQTISALPLYLLAGGPGGDGNLLAFLVIVLFVFVLVLI